MPGLVRRILPFGPMVDVVRQSTQQMGDADRHAIADYLPMLPARPVLAATDAMPDADCVV